VDALLKRRPQPLAIIGGSSSEQAREVALNLAAATHDRPKEGPLLLLTTATAEVVQKQYDPLLNPDPNQSVRLMSIYPDRTFRFCFTNRQMAEAVSDFIWGHEELRPEGEPIFAAQWSDDAYSVDLTGYYYDALNRPLLTRAVGRQWATFAGLAATGGVPFDLASFPLCEFSYLSAVYIDYSVGLFDQPNRWEMTAAQHLIEAKADDRRNLLVLASGEPQPARRFLRSLMRIAPTEARRFVVVTGDGLSFNTVYRDRNVAWPIQDLPFDLVFFCHRNPLADAPTEEGQVGGPEQGLSATGTEDLLLYQDIVEVLVQSAYQGNDMPAEGSELGRLLRQASWHNDQIDFDPSHGFLFTAEGDRAGGTGEYIVWLHPTVEGERVLPQATLTIESPGKAGLARAIEYKPN
jgi:hypothetical protein